jgi:hypothetical protein
MPCRAYLDFRVLKIKCSCCFLSGFQLTKDGQNNYYILLANSAILILLIPLSITVIVYFKCLYKLNELPETVNVKADVNLNDGIILNKDENFKITIEKDETGRICIRRA